MMYILAVQPAIMSAAGMARGAVFTVTALSAGVSTLVMAFAARLPVALASGIGANVFIAFTMCAALGWNWQTAMAAVFVEGLLFLVFALSGARDKIARAIPEQVKKGAALGIGVMIAVIGLDWAGIINTDGAALLSVNRISFGAPLLAVITLALNAVLYIARVPGSIFIAMAAGAAAGIPMGVTVLPEGFSPAAAPPAPYTPFDIIAGLEAVDAFGFAAALLAMLFIDIFDAVSTFAGIAIQSKMFGGDGRIVNYRAALVSNALCVSALAMFGATTVVPYIESAAGVARGGRTGLSSVITGTLFLAALFFSPVFLLFPPAVMAGALIFIGSMMTGSLCGLELRKMEVGLPVFITLLIIPASFSVLEGITWGFASFVIIKLAQGRARDISVETAALTALFLVKQIV
jgi:AGZA family xanthine/uracil permease-like MFS transporter